MADKMLIDATHPEETRVVVLRGNRVEEFDFESANRKQLRGNIYLAKVTRVEPSLQAAFVDYGGNRHGFLAFSEIHPDYYQIPVADRQALIAQEVLDSHLRSLMPGHLTDVESTDRHTVKPWFNGKLPQSPRVVDLAAQDFTLVGGRIDVIGLMPAPTLVYRRRLHLISLTALPVAQAAAAPRRAIDGYNVVEWTEADHAYWAVSDLARPELEEFAAAFRAGEPEP